MSQPPKSGVPSVTKSHPTCEVCRSSESLKACGSCTQVWYCSKEHQKQDWKSHKPICKAQTHSDGTLASEQDKMVLQMAGLSVKKHLMKATEDGNSLSTNPNNHIAETSSVDRTLPADLPPHLTTSWLTKTASDIVQCLNQFGIAVVNNFLSQQLGDKVLTEAQSLREREYMHDGQTLSTDQNTASVARQSYRTDKIAWVSGTEPHCVNIGTLMSLMDTLISHMQAILTSYKIQGRTQAMVACYPGNGAHYVRHVDNPHQDGRLLTCIYYLNKDWNCREDGGMLKIYPAGTTRVASIQPIFDRLLVFWSDKRNPHEVLPAYKTRYAVTVWYFDANERLRATTKSIRENDNESSS